jgi:hypothetical protein
MYTQKLLLALYLHYYILFRADRDFLYLPRSRDDHHPNPSFTPALLMIKAIICGDRFIAPAFLAVLNNVLINYAPSIRTILRLQSHHLCLR